MYTTEIIMLISWPVFLYVAYKITSFVITKYEKKTQE